ncbi:MAG: Dabb family protein [Deltaproteobacteria bacterium]|nr:MAG: Dabb family protein [Deltaproteobacteria bacterium]
MLTHVVLFKFKPETTAAQAVELETRLKGLPALIAEIREFRVGADVVRSERSFDLALVSAFDDLAAMQRYQVHPAHQEVVALVKACCGGVVAVDFSE